VCVYRRIKILVIGAGIDLRLLFDNDVKVMNPNAHGSFRFSLVTTASGGVAVTLLAKTY